MIKITKFVHRGLIDSKLELVQLMTSNRQQAFINPASPGLHVSACQNEDKKNKSKIKRMFGAKPFSEPMAGSFIYGGRFLIKTYIYMIYLSALLA